MCKVGLIESGGKQSQMVPRAQLIVSDAAGGILEVTVKLAGSYAQNATGSIGVTPQAILSSRKKPWLNAISVTARNDDVFRDAGRDEVGVAEVRAPLVAGAIDKAIGVANQQAGFQASVDAGIVFIDGKVEVFDKHSAVR